MAGPTAMTEEEFQKELELLETDIKYGHFGDRARLRIIALRLERLEKRIETLIEKLSK